MTPRIAPHILIAWQRAAYEAGGAVVRIGRRSPALDAVLDAGLAGHEGVFITACNPHGRKMPPGWNARAMRRLQGAVRGRAVVPGHGYAAQGVRWCEPHLLVAIDLRRARVLARRFRQGGIVHARQGRAAALVIP